MTRFTFCLSAVICLLTFGVVIRASDEKNTDAGRPMKYAIVVHGGAGTIAKDIDPKIRDEYLQTLSAALDAGQKILVQGGTALDAVETVVRFLEDDPKFNAGKGAVFTHDQQNELDASIMDGATLDCGAVAGATTVKNPITLARRIMEQSRHILFSGHGAEVFADEVGVERVSPEYFRTEKRMEQLHKAQQRSQSRNGSPHFIDDRKFGTVGCVARDQQGDLAAATSTGGLTNKQHGRIGDSPIIGAGNYADNNTCAVSGTGIGEEFIRHSVGHHIAAIMKYRGASLQEAADIVVHEVLQPGQGGVIAVSRDGDIVMTFNTPGMFRAAADSSGRREVKIWE